MVVTEKNCLLVQATNRTIVLTKLESFLHLNDRAFRVGNVVGVNQIVL